MTRRESIDPGRRDYDVLIVGGSLAGASMATSLAPAGYRILVLDRAIFPRHKCCGEGIMPQGVSILDELGLLPEILARGGRKFQGMRLRSLQGVCAEGEFPSVPDGSDFGVVMPRYELDHVLLQRAKTFANVTVQEGFEVTSVLQEGEVVQGIEGHAADSPGQTDSFRAPLTIGADGPSSIFHGQCRLSKSYLPRRRFGVTGHLTGVEGVDSYVEVLAHPEGEIYLAPCGGGMCLVALLLEGRAMSSFRGERSQCYVDLLRSTPGFGERISHSELIGPVLIAGPLGFTVEPSSKPGLLLIGDSAGFLDPITGEGMTLTLKSVRAAVPLIREAFATSDFGGDLLARFAEERLDIVKELFLITELVLRLSRHKRLANRAIRRLSRDRALFRKLLGIVTGTHRYSDLSFADKFSMLLG